MKEEKKDVNESCNSCACAANNIEETAIEKDPCEGINGENICVCTNCESAEN